MPRRGIPEQPARFWYTEMHVLKGDMMKCPSVTQLSQVKPYQVYLFFFLYPPGPLTDKFLCSDSLIPDECLPLKEGKTIPFQIIHERLPISSDAMKRLQLVQRHCILPFLPSPNKESGLQRQVVSCINEATRGAPDSQ